MLYLSAHDLLYLFLSEHFCSQTLMVPVDRMQAVLKVIREAYPDANIARVVERIPSVLSRNATR